MGVICVGAPHGCYTRLIRVSFVVVTATSPTSASFSTLEIAEPKAAGSNCLIQARFHSTRIHGLPPDERSQDRQKEVASVRESTRSLSLLSTLHSRSRGAVVWIALSLFCVLCLFGSAMGGMFWRWVTKRILGKQDEKREPKGKQSDEDESDRYDVDSGESGSDTKSPKVKIDDEVHEHYTSGKLYEDYVKEYWAAYSHSDAPDIFGHDNLRVATDGGFGRVPQLKVKFLKAAQVLGAGLLNIFLIIVTDVAALTGHGPKMNYGTDDFLIIKWLARMMLTDTEEKFAKTILHNDINMLLPALELAFTFYVACTIIVYVVLALLAPRLFKKHGPMYRWSYAADVQWWSGPQLASCSALRLLYFVTPKIIRSDAYMSVLHAWQTITMGHTFRHYANGTFYVVCFAVSRVFALILGFDAFLVKFRLASNALDTGTAELLSILQAGAFLWQVIGIINLDWFVRDRFFVFIFAGKDGTLDIDEMALVEVWKALFFRQVVEVHGLLSGCVIMLAFDDYDMQFLVLDDDEAMIQAFVSESMAVSSRRLSADSSRRISTGSDKSSSSPRSRSESLRF